MRGQALARNKLHHQIVGADVVQRAYIRMVQRGNGSGLTLESRAELIVDDFDRDEAIEAGISRLVDMAHTARTEQTNHLIRAQLRTA